MRAPQTFPVFGSAFCLVLFSWVHAAPHAATWRDPSPHVERLIPVQRGVRVEVLDWRGSGEALVLLAGHGDTGHIFDHFPPHLTDRFRVVVLTRRGFGASSQPEGGFELERLVKDIADVSDTLNLGRVHLVGHSIA